MEIVTDFILGGSKITADDDCCHEIKRCLLLERKALTNLDSVVKKQRHYFANKGPTIKAMFFPVVMNGCEGWNILQTCQMTLSSEQYFYKAKAIVIIPISDQKSVSALHLEAMF